MEARYVKRFSASERVAHWLQFLAFIVLLGTGGFLYMPALRAFAIGPAGEAARLSHRVAAVVFMISPLIYLIGDPKSFFGSLRDAFSWGSDDIKWLRLAWQYYTKGSEVEIPPQGKYNGGQKLNALVQIILFVLFTVTGLILWFGPTLPAVSSAVFLWSLVLHDLSVIVAVAFFLLHLYLVAIHPFTREAIISMFEGVVTREYAQEHHTKWYEEIKGA
ncbi:MAG: formate dehydrogenase subunit gamma [Anaerolineae bacterium]